MRGDLGRLPVAAWEAQGHGLARRQQCTSSTEFLNATQVTVNARHQLCLMTVS